MDDQDQPCPCCHSSLHNADHGPAHALTCGHVFHTECINEWLKNRGCELDNLPCPVCKLTGNQIEERKNGVDAPSLPENTLPAVVDGGDSAGEEDGEHVGEKQGPDPIPDR